MRSKEIKDYIRNHSALFWYSPEDKTETVTDELLVETIINYGTLDDVRDLFKVVGLQNVAAIFQGMKERKKMNFYPELWNYFNLYFTKYVPQYS